ncbi:tyrosine-type recombinase/integrase [Arthrobacter pigmenti]
MSLLAPALERFFTVHLIQELNASPHTITAYRDAWMLLLSYLRQHSRTATNRLELEVLDAATIGAFLKHLQQDRGNGIRTRNARLAAIHAFFRYTLITHPEHAGTIGEVLALPMKRNEHTNLTFLTEDEARLLADAPDRQTRTGRRDRAMLLTAITTGLRVSELTGLQWQDLTLGPTAYLTCLGKGRRTRITPLNKETTAVLALWRAELGANGHTPVFPSNRGTPMSTDAVAQRVTTHAATAAANCPTLKDKHITPHTLRHTCAMRLLQNGVDTSTIALWLGHQSPETTQIYLHEDMNMKEKALASITPTGITAARFAPDTELMAFLQGL